MLRFAEELLILTTGGEELHSVALPARTMGYSLAGAVLMDLALENRIDSDLEQLYVTDPTPVGDSLLDPVLAEIVSEPKIHPTRAWVARIAERGDELQALATDRLVEAGILETDDGGGVSMASWVARSRRYPDVDGGGAKQEIQSRIISILLSDDIPDSRDSVIIGLAHACGLFRRMLDKKEYEEVRERIELISGLELVTQAVIDAVHNISLAESQALRRVIQEKGGGWPKASGRLPVLGHSFKMRGDLRAFFTEQYLKLGPVFEIQVPGHRFVVLAGQEANLFMMRDGRTHLRTWEQWAGFSSELGALNIVTALDGVEHRRLRKTMREGYSRKSAVRQMPELVSIVDRELSKLFQEGSPVPGFYTMQRIMIEQVSVLASGTSSADTIDDAIAFIQTMELVYLARRRPKLALRTPRLKRARRRMELLFEQVLAAHEPELRAGAHRDLVDDLLELHDSAPEFMSDTDLFINVMGPLIVGVDTVAGTTAFMLNALLERPDLMERVRAEADEMFSGGGPTAESLHAMTVTQRTILETLRMYPIVPALYRVVANSFNFEGYRIPAGTPVLMAIAVPHYLPQFFPDPELFDIDRYSPERHENAQPGAFAPFGLGHHSCLGQGFAQVQMILTIATLLHRAEIALDPSGYRLKIDHAPVPSPDRNFKVQVSPRRA